MRLPFGPAVIALALLVSACPVEGTGDLMDASVDADGGDGTDPCLGQPEEVDSGLAQACDPSTGNACDISAGRSCVWVASEDRGACRCLSARAALGEACTEDKSTCAAGLVCLQITGDTTPSCKQVCALPEGAACDPLRAADPNTAYACLPLRITMTTVTQDFGICYPIGTSCDPLSDQCPSDEVCTLAGRVPSCGALGTTALDGNCSDEPCNRGGLCVALQDRPTPTCYQACSMLVPGCPSGKHCTENLQGLAFGLCI